MATDAPQRLEAGSSGRSACTGPCQLTVVMEAVSAMCLTGAEAMVQHPERVDWGLSEVAVVGAYSTEPGIGLLVAWEGNASFASRRHGFDSTLPRADLIRTLIVAGRAREPFAEMTLGGPPKCLPRWAPWRSWLDRWAEDREHLGRRGESALAATATSAPGLTFG